jgi:hypothetical protein
MKSVKPFSRRFTASPAREIRSSTLHACQSPYAGQVPPAAGIVDSTAAESTTAFSSDCVAADFGGAFSPPHASTARATNVVALIARRLSRVRDMQRNYHVATSRPDSAQHSVAMFPNLMPVA